MASVTMVTTCMGSGNGGSFRIGCFASDTCVGVGVSSYNGLCGIIPEGAVRLGNVVDSNAGSVAIGVCVVANSLGGVAIGYHANACASGCMPVTALGIGASGHDMQGAIVVGSRGIGSQGSTSGCNAIAIGPCMKNGGCRAVMIGSKAGCANGTLPDGWVSLADGRVAISFDLCAFAYHLAGCLGSDAFISYV